MLRAFRYSTVACLACALAAILLPGCGGPMLMSSQSVDHVDLMTQPVAANLDGIPGPDGLQVRVYFYHGYKTVAGRGSLELLLFDGCEPQRDLRLARPIQTWSFSRKQLRSFVASSYGLRHYQLALRWSGNKPKSKMVTILARYSQADGKEVYSQPVVVPVRLE